MLTDVSAYMGAIIAAIDNSINASIISAFLDPIVTTDSSTYIIS